MTLRRDYDISLPEIRADSEQLIQATLNIALSRRLGDSGRASGEARLRRLFDNVPVLLAYLDPSGHYQVANRLHEKWFGVAADKLAGRSMLEVLGPLWNESMQPSFAEVLAGHAVSIDYRGNDPQDRDAQVHLVPDKTSTGVRGVYLAACNVTGQVALAAGGLVARVALVQTADVAARVRDDGRLARRAG